MKHLKIFEEYKNYTEFILEDILQDLVIFNPSGKNIDELLKPRYPEINFIDYLKDLMLNKVVTFTSVNKVKKNNIITGKIVDIDYFFYQITEVYIEVKIDGEIESFLVDGNKPVKVYNYKPGALQDKLKIIKDAKKFGL